MVQSGRNSPVKEGKDTNLSPLPKWVFRTPNARRKLKRAATPHPGKVGGNTKRDALVSLTESGRVRKKSVFEFEEPAAGINGGTNAPAGVGKVSSPTGDRKGGRWTRKARPGPFEALHFSMGQTVVEPGVLPLLARDLRFSMGKKETLARDRPEIVAGTGQTGVAGSRLEDGRPAEMSAVAQATSQSTRVGAAASVVGMDEDKFPDGNGANLLSELSTLAAPFLEKPSCVLASETCDLSHGQSNLNFKLDAGTSPLPEEANAGGEAKPDGEPPAPEYSPEESPEQNTVQHDNDKSHPEEPAFGENSENLSGGLESGGASKTDPVTLDADHDKEMGTAGSCEGVPLLTFSNEETKYLADKIGHAVIGKFSHTIPSSQQIQKSLSNIQLVDGFKWKFVNAKHILIQFRDVRDYGRMLNGPNGSPVWFIEHHPMRVFKWTPDFDTFFESPIAAVWCKVIGLPIHLYDQVALIAIGKLLGKPIQLDHATFNQNRLTFARICIEIDISTPPPEEIILNILGKDTRYKVVWDRIPLFCAECKHVGHVKEACFALGKKEGQPSKEPYRPSHNRRSKFASESARREWRPKKPSPDTHTPKPVRERPRPRRRPCRGQAKKRGTRA